MNHEGHEDSRRIETTTTTPLTPHWRVSSIYFVSFVSFVVHFVTVTYIPPSFVLHLPAAMATIFSFWREERTMSQTKLRLPRLFSDNMVLQQGVAVPVWGWAPPGRGRGASCVPPRAWPRAS